MRAASLSSRPAAGATLRPRGWWYPWLFVAALGLVVAVNGVLISYAVGSFSGLDTAQPYERGLDYNATLAAARAQEEMGWRVEFDAAPVGAAALPQPVAIEARFLNRDGEGLSNLSVQAVLRRPAAQGSDMELALAERGGGRYVAQTALPMRGQWELRIVAEGEGASWQSSRRVLLP